MRGPWPLIGRDEELRLIAEILARPGHPGIVIGGEAGTGKTRLAREALRAAEDAGHDVERIVGSRATATIPFGGFATVLPDLDPAASPLDHLRAAVEAISRRASQGRLVLVVDDAHLLGDASAALLHRVVVAGVARVVATVRSGEPAPEPVVALWKDAEAERIDLQRLSREETLELVRGGLGGEVDGATAHRIWTASRGSPLYVRELVLGAQATGALERDGGVWQLTGPLEMPPSLSELVDARLVGLDEEAGRVLRTLAVADATGLADLQALHPAALDELERRGLLDVTPDGRRRTVRLAHPLYGEVLRRRMPRTEVIAASAAMADRIEVCGARRRDDPLRVATLRLDAGERHDPDALVEAAREAYRRGDFDLAERILAGAPDDVVTVEPRLLLAQVLHETGRHGAAEEMYAEAADDDHPEGLAVRTAIQRAVNLIFGLGETDRAIDLLTGTQARIDDEYLAAELAANRAWFLLLVGRPGEARQLVEPLLDAVEPDTAVMAAVTHAWIGAVTGRTDEALDAVRRAEQRRTGTTRLNRFRDFPDLPRALALVEDGRLDDAAVLIGEGYTTSLDRHPGFIQGWWVLLAAVEALRRGRPRTAAAWFRQGAALQRRLHQDGYVRWHLAGLALAQSTIGDVAAGAAALAEHDAIRRRPVRLFADLADRARAWNAALSGDRDAARAILLGAAEAAVSTGLLANASVALHDLVRLGAAELAVGPLAEIAGATSSAAIDLRAAHAAASAAGDVEALVEVAGSWEEAAADLLAAETYAEAAALLAHGERRRAQGLRRRAAALAAACEGAATPGVRSIPEVVPLTDRERQVALLAARTMTSKQIAARLHVSRRTVDNLLQRAYTKLGVGGRGELAAALAIGPEDRHVEPV